MVDDQLIKNTPIDQFPTGQKVSAALMWINHNLPPRSTIEIEGLENIPKDQPLIFAMNHTDRYTCWPFQYKLIKIGGYRCTATWIKAKYFKNPIMRWVFRHNNGIPLPSRGYLILQDATRLLKRSISSEDYRLLRDVSEGALAPEQALAQANSDIRRVLSEPREGFTPANETYAEYIDQTTNYLMRLVEARTLEALGPKQNNLIVFPQGTRSKRLLPARTGMMQFALRHKITVVPVGANGIDRLYPGASPWARRADVVYRVGKPMTHDLAFADCQIDEPYTPFTREAKAFEVIFERGSVKVTQAINDLLDEPYRLGDPSTKATQTNRLI